MRVTIQLLRRGGMLAVPFLFSVSLGVQPADATLITVNFTGVVASSGASVSGVGGINISDVVTGSFTYESTTAESASSTGASDYSYFPGAVQSFSITIGSFSATSSSTGSVFVDDDRMAGSGAPFRDRFIASGIGLTGASVNGLAPLQVQFGLASEVLSRLSSDALPTTELDNFLASEGTSSINILNFGTGSPSEKVRFDLTTLNGVPEPSSALLLGLGIAGVVVRRLRAA